MLVWPSELTRWLDNARYSGGYTGGYTGVNGQGTISRPELAFYFHKYIVLPTDVAKYASLPNRVRIEFGNMPKRTAQLELDNWPSLRHMAASRRTGCTLSTWLHAEQDSTTKQFWFAVGMRLCVNMCEPHTCLCGTLVDVNGSHGIPQA